MKIDKRLNYKERDWRKGNSLHGRRLTENGMHLERGFATVLTLVTPVTMRMAIHRVTALHCLLGLYHATTVDSVHRKSDGQCHQKNPFRRPHDK
jgi:hypothetical protein